MSVKRYDNKGYTFLELMITMCIFGLLIHITGRSYLDYRQNAFNTIALTDGRNLATVISNSLVDEDDVDYTHTAADGQYIGRWDNEGNSRSALFALSEGVKARIEGSSRYYGGVQGYMMAYIYHENGSRDLSTDSDKREYLCLVDELAGVITFSRD